MIVFDYNTVTQGQILRKHVYIEKLGMSETHVMFLHATEYIHVGGNPKRHATHAAMCMIFI